MIEIKGSVSNAICYVDHIDNGSTGLITALCNSHLSEMCKIRIMPDVHAGKGCAVGTTILFNNKIAPGLLGVDIGCGVSAMKVTPKKTKNIDLNKLDKFITQSIPSGKNIHDDAQDINIDIDSMIFDRLNIISNINYKKALQSIGTLGGGNHFIEVDNSSDGSYWIIVHTGSRHLGVEVKEYYHNLAWDMMHPLSGIPYEFAYLMDDHMKNYMNDVYIVTEYARINRLMILKRIAREMKFKEIELFDSIHNTIDTDHKILRKGAIASEKNTNVIIPINMRDGCIFGKGKGNPDWNYSAPHGAGRLLSRSDAKNSITLTEYKKAMDGIYSSKINRSTIDEAPMAYKPIDEIIEAIEPTVEILDIWKPIYNFKASS